jgi:hypothetical protein
MCWRDEIRTTRTCILCHQKYFGDLGHRDCPEFQKKDTLDKKEDEKPKEPPKETDPF